MTGNRKLARDLKDFDKGFADMWRVIGHTIGPFHYQRMTDQVRIEFGDEYLSKNKKDFHSAALKGVWSWEVYPDAVKYFLKNQ